ncbi:MAG: hypothetical protein LIO59_01905 [Oscillospiraceae bacterium]|nr:hypothetical protein [Oscillospiraceae bacterium]
MKIYIIGIGMGNADTLTNGAKIKIEAADVLAGAKRMTAPLSYQRKIMLALYDIADFADCI